MTVDEARAFVKHVESLFTPWHVEALVAGFTEDCVVRFGDLPEFRVLSGDTLSNYWEGEWEDSRTGAKMTGRGVEVWVMRDGRIAVWEAAFNAREAGKASAMGLE